MPRLIGWREWAALPDLGIDAIKLKADTGARTSALHAVAIRAFKIDDEEWVEFELSAIVADGDDADTQDSKPRRARVVDHRTIRDSGGHEETRVTVETTLCMGEVTRPIELTLTDREAMGFRMLLGRTAMADHFYVDPESSYLLGTRATARASAKREQALAKQEEE